MKRQRIRITCVSWFFASTFLLVPDGVAEWGTAPTPWIPPTRQHGPPLNVLQNIPNMFSATPKDPCNGISFGGLLPSTSLEDMTYFFDHSGKTDLGGVPIDRPFRCYIVSKVEQRRLDSVSTTYWWEKPTYETLEYTNPLCPAMFSVSTDLTRRYLFTKADGKTEIGSWSFQSLNDQAATADNYIYGAAGLIFYQSATGEDLYAARPERPPQYMSGIGEARLWVRKYGEQLTLHYRAESNISFSIATQPEREFSRSTLNGYAICWDETTLKPIGKR